MYQVNDYVVYGATGVCQVVEISQESFGGPTSREYYVLNPVFGNSMQIYIPTDSQKVVMRRILTRQEILDLIKVMPDIDSEWVSDDNLRKATFSDAIQSGDQRRLVQLIKTIYARGEDLEKSGKRLSNTDRDLIKAAEKLLYNEFALVLDIQPDQVVPFILEQVTV